MSAAVWHPGRTGRASSRRRGVPRGMVLIIVTVVMVMLSLAGLSFVATMHAENKAAHAEGRRLQLEHVVASGAELIKTFCEQSWAEQQEAGGTWDNADRFRDVLVREEEDAGGGSRFSILSPKSERGAAAEWRYGLENESAKLNLGTLLRWDQREPGAARRALMCLPEMTSSIADAILDWIDPDATPRPGGAEADYYRELEVPYGPRNGVPQCLEELLLVRGVTRELLFGRDSARAAPRTFAAPQIPWAALLTVASAERNETLDGRPRIDVNGDNLAAVHQKLSTALDRSWADFIVFYRQNGPYQGRRAPSAAPPQVDLTLPARFKIASLLDLIGARVRLPGERRTAPVVGSPLSADQPGLHDGLTRLLDVGSVVRAPIIEGKINVNLAPRPVLLAVPGMEPALADRILMARGSHGAHDDAQRHFPVWLLSEGLVDLPRLKALLPHLTGGGDVVRAQILGYDEQHGTAMRVELMIDAASSPSRQIYWKDLRLLGPPSSGAL